MNPRTRRVRQTILDAAIELLVEHGAQAVTARRVAEHADVARTTIYRHWPDQATLLLATIDALTAPHHVATSSGSLRADVIVDLQNLRTRLVVRDVRAVFGALAAHSATDPAFAAAQHRFIERLVDPLAGSLREARDRGELPPDVDCGIEADLLAGPLLHLYLVSHVEITDQWIDDVTVRWFAVHDVQ